MSSCQHELRGRGYAPWPPPTALPAAAALPCAASSVPRAAPRPACRGFPSACSRGCLSPSACACPWPSAAASGPGPVSSFCDPVTGCLPFCPPDAVDGRVVPTVSGSASQQTVDAHSSPGDSAPRAGCTGESCPGDVRTGLRRRSHHRVPRRALPSTRVSVHGALHHDRGSFWSRSEMSADRRTSFLAGFVPHSTNTHLVLACVLTVARCAHALRPCLTAAAPMSGIP